MTGPDGWQVLDELELLISEMQADLRREADRIGVGAGGRRRRRHHEIEAAGETLQILRDRLRVRYPAPEPGEAPVVTGQVVFTSS